MFPWDDVFVWIILWTDSERTGLCLTVWQRHSHLWYCKDWKGCVLIFSERMGFVCRPLRAYHTFALPLPEVHKATLFLPLSLCILPLLLWGFCLYSVLHRKPLPLDTFWATDCFCTKRHLCMHVVVRTIMWPQNTLLWYMYVNISVEHCSSLRLLAYAE